MRIFRLIYINNIKSLELVHARLRGMVFTSHTNTPFKLFGGIAVCEPNIADIAADIAIPKFEEFSVSPR